MKLMTQNVIMDLAIIFITLYLLVIAYFKWVYSYWERNGIPTLRDSLIIPFGHGKDTILRRKTLGEEYRIIYNNFKAKGVDFGGVFMGMNKFIVPISPEFLRSILQRDFQYFTSHGIYHYPELEPLTGHLFNLEGAKWKDMRVTLNPTFTSGKMKIMFPTVVDCATRLKNIINQATNNNLPVNIKEVVERFTMDVIVSCILGIECNCAENPNLDFLNYGKKIFIQSNFDRLKLVLTTMLPLSIIRLLKIKILKPGVENFFLNVIEKAVNYREKHNIFRKDLMHFLIQLKNRGAISDDEKIIANNSEKIIKALSIQELAAQAFIFYVAGFETSATTMTFALYEIATHPEIQSKIIKEINKILANHNNELSYEAIMEMTYVHQVVEETLRLHPPAANLHRQCTKNYQIPNTSILIKKGTRVIIPVLGIHSDPEYYPNPEVFDPDRFSEENRTKRPPCTFLSFGDGPRICIALRFGLMQTKIGLVTLLKNYRFTLNDKTQLPFKLDKNSIITAIEGGIWLNAEKVTCAPS